MCISSVTLCAMAMAIAQDGASSKDGALSVAFTPGELPLAVALDDDVFNPTRLDWMAIAPPDVTAPESVAPASSAVEVKGTRASQPMGGMVTPTALAPEFSSKLDLEKRSQASAHPASIRSSKSWEHEALEQSADDAGNSSGGSSDESLEEWPAGLRLEPVVLSHANLQDGAAFELSPTQAELLLADIRVDAAPFRGDAQLVAPLIRIDDILLPYHRALPRDFVFPLTLLIGVDEGISDNAPITTLRSPIPQSPRVAELQQFLLTPPPSILVPNSGPTFADYSGPGLSLLREAREFIPQVPVQTAPIIREQLIATIEEINRVRAGTPSLTSWADDVRACLAESPLLYTIDADNSLAPILFDGRPGRIVRNAAGHLVCPI